MITLSRGSELESTTKGSRLLNTAEQIGIHNANTCLFCFIGHLDGHEFRKCSKVVGIFQFKLVP